MFHTFYPFFSSLSEIASYRKVKNARTQDYSIIKNSACIAQAIRNPGSSW